MSGPDGSPQKNRLMTAPEWRFLIGLIQVFVGLGLASFMTHNQFTQTGWALVWITLIGGFVGLLLGLAMKRSRLQHLGNGLLLVFVLLAGLLQFSPPRPEPGLLIDTTDAHRRYHRVRPRGGDPAMSDAFSTEDRAR